MAVTIHARSGDILTDEDTEPWCDVPVAVAVDQVPEEQLDIGIRPINAPRKQPRLFGKAVTVQAAPPDFGAVLHALELVRPGDVLVIAADGQSGAAMIGEILSGFLRTRGAAGVVCDGAVRDVATLAGWPDFSVFARHINPRGPSSSELGSVQCPVNIGDRVVNPGDLIIGDDDGLVALSPMTVRDRIHDAKAKLALEAQWIDALSSGRSVAQTFGLSPGTPGR